MLEKENYESNDLKGLGSLMYRKKTSSWLKHWDFILLDLILLELSYLLAHWLYHGTAYYREAPLYRNVFLAIAAIDLVVGLMMESYKGILRRAALLPVSDATIP